MSVLDSKRARANRAGANAQAPSPAYGETPTLQVQDDFSSATALPDLPELGAEEEVPPAYSEVHDHLSLHQAGFDAGATVTGKLPPPLALRGYSCSGRQTANHYHHRRRWPS